MNTKHYLTKETCQWLEENGCEIESEYYWFINDVAKWELTFDLKDLKNSKYYSAYSWHDVLITHSKDFFGEEKILNPQMWKVTAFEYHCHKFLSLLQQDKIEEAEKYFKNNCIFKK